MVYSTHTVFVYSSKDGRRLFTIQQHRKFHSTNCIDDREIINSAVKLQNSHLSDSSSITNKVITRELTKGEVKDGHLVIPAILK